MFVPAVLSAIYNKNRWGLVLHLNTYCVVAGGLMIFVLISVITRYLYVSRAKKVGSKEQGRRLPDLFKVENWKVNLLFIYVMAISLMYLYYVYKIVGTYYGRNLSWTETMSRFRYLVSYGNGNIKVPVLVEQGHQFVNSIGIVSIYVLLHNYVISGIIQKNVLLLIIVSTISSLLDSGRLNVIVLIVAIVTLYDIFHKYYKGNGVKVNIKFIIRAIVGFIALCGGFVWLKQVAGRVDDKDPFYYITYYLGQSIRNLDVYLQKTPKRPEIWGKETFYGWNHFLYLITGKEQFNYIVHKEFLYYKGASTGNVYTMFRAYIHDFGYGGLIILTGLFAFIISIWYLKIKFKRRETCKRFDKSIICYSYLMFTVYTAFFADYFFCRVLSLFILKFIFYIFLLEFFLIKLKLVRGVGYEKGREVNGHYSNI